MNGYTVKELKKIIMNYKKSNCPAVSRGRRDELLKIIKNLNINGDEGKCEQLERKKKEPKKEPKIERPKAILRKTDKIKTIKKDSDIKVKVEKAKKEDLIGGNDLFKFVNYPDDFLDNIKILYPRGYDILKIALEKIRVQNKKDKSFFNIDDYFDKEFKNPIFFNNKFFRNLIKREDVGATKEKLKMLFNNINKKFTDKDIEIPSLLNPIILTYDYPITDIYGIKRYPGRKYIK